MVLLERAKGGGNWEFGGAFWTYQLHFELLVISSKFLFYFVFD